MMAVILSSQFSCLIKASGMISDFFNLTPAASERKLLFINTLRRRKVIYLSDFCDCI